MPPMAPMYVAQQQGYTAPPTQDDAESISPAEPQPPVGATEGFADKRVAGPAQETQGTTVSNVDQAQAVDAPAVVEAPAAKATKKTKVKGKDSSSGNPKYKDMVMDAIITQKERSGSSLGAIKNHLGSKYKVDVAKKAGILNRLQFIANINILCVFVLSV